MPKTVELQIGDLSESLENYLEAILDICRSNKVARVRDVAKQLGVRDASVTQAVKVLEDKGLVSRTPNGFVDLTDKGHQLAAEVEHRHQVLTSFLVDVLKIPQEVADDEACRMEHSLSPQTFEKFVLLTRFISLGPKQNCRWLDRFDAFCNDEKSVKPCTNNEDCSPDK